MVFRYLESHKTKVAIGMSDRSLEVIRHVRTGARILFGVLLASSAWGSALESELAAIAQGFDGRVGVCVQSAGRTDCVRGGERFSLQSVMKLVVGVAVLDQVDRGLLRLDTPVTVHTADLSLYVQPLARLVGPEGYRTTLGDLVRRAIIDSDSAATEYPDRPARRPGAGAGGSRVQANHRHPRGPR